MGFWASRRSGWSNLTSASATSIGPGVPGTQPYDPITSARRTGAITSPVVAPCCQTEGSLYSSVCAFSNPASFSVFKINSAASRDPWPPVFPPPMLSVSVSRNSIAPLLVSECPTIRGIVSSEVAALAGAGAVPCARADTAPNRKHNKECTRKRIATSVNDANHLNTTTSLSSRGYDARLSAIRSAFGKATIRSYQRGSAGIRTLCLDLYLILDLAFSFTNFVGGGGRGSFFFLFFFFFFF